MQSSLSSSSALLFQMSVFWRGSEYSQVLFWDTLQFIQSPYLVQNYLRTNADESSFLLELCSLIVEQLTRALSSKINLQLSLSVLLKELFCWILLCK